jgi:hypothetical protein
MKDYLGNVLVIGDKCIRCASLNSTEFTKCVIVDFKEKKYRSGKTEMLVEILTDGLSKTGRTYPDRLIKLSNI